jgi:hypothetical protein
MLQSHFYKPLILTPIQIYPKGVHALYCFENNFIRCNVPHLWFVTSASKFVVLSYILSVPTAEDPLLSLVNNLF